MLGPILFSIYINDLPDVNLVDDCKQCRPNIYLYADDAKIYKSVETVGLRNGVIRGYWNLT